MRTIVLFGAGKSSTVLIQYLLDLALVENWQLIVIDADLHLAKSKIKEHPQGSAFAFDINDEEKRKPFIEAADLVLSLLPPSLHYIVAKDCIHFRKNLLTASYIDELMEGLRKDVEQNNLLFLCEMGLDPGLDHMSAKKLIDEIQADGGEITSFISHCGGLVAPESDNNPWHYKISWNPRNIVNAGKAGAVYKQNNAIKSLAYEQIFAGKRYVHIGEEMFCWYPNRDSVKYADQYRLGNCPTFIRTTLRHPDFMYGWKNIVDLKLTDETVQYETTDKTLMHFFKEHMDRHQFNTWLEQKLQRQLEETQNLLNNLVNLVKMEDKADDIEKAPDDFMMVNEKGDLQEVDIDDLKNNAAATIAFKMHESKLTLRQLFFLGMDDDKTVINKGKCSAADVLQFALEKKLELKETDKDMVVMMHEIEYIRGNKTNKTESVLMLTAENSEQTAMAKTVGLPLGIAARLVLNGSIKMKGLHIPTTKEIYLPVLSELEKSHIIFKEVKKTL